MLVQPLQEAYLKSQELLKFPNLRLMEPGGFASLIDVLKTDTLFTVSKAKTTDLIV